MGDAVGQSPKYALEARFLSAGGLSSSERKGVCFRRLYWLTIDKKKRLYQLVLVVGKKCDKFTSIGSPDSTLVAMAT